MGFQHKRDYPVEPVLRYTMDELLTQREHAMSFGMDVSVIEIEIMVVANRMADDVEAVLNQPDERPYDWEVDGE